METSGREWYSARRLDGATRNIFPVHERNAIYKTVIERKGRNALELLGFKHSFWGKENVDKVELESKKEKKSESAAALVKNLRSEISRLETLLSLGNH